MDQLLTSLIGVLIAVWNLLIAILVLAVPWTPLIAWLSYWLWGVNWARLWPKVAQGGWVGIVLLGLVATLVWGTIAPPVGGVHSLLGLTLSNFVGKFVYVTALLTMTLLCGSVQLSGACGNWARFAGPAREESHDEHAHAAAH